jgi:hypothetical protein
MQNSKCKIGAGAQQVSSISDLLCGFGFDFFSPFIMTHNTSVTKLFYGVLSFG